MKSLAPILPYLAVGFGLFWVHSGWIALLGFHLGILISLFLAKPDLPINLLFKSNHIRWVILNLILCGSSGVSLYLLQDSFGIVSDLPVQLQSAGLTRASWPLFIAYFVLVNPFVEEYFWRGYLGSPARGLSISDFLYSGFHGLILIGKMYTVAVIYSLTMLVLVGWFWRQTVREDGGLLAPVLGHMAADFTILLAVYLMSNGV
jgi:membrane protease YdiL (CAAX protease family)